MKIFCISDLHLSFFREKPMDIFGSQWKDHHKKIRENWIEMITEEDLVLVSGDTSWAMSLEEAVPDLTFVDGLPGRKIMIPGNHDFWWKSTDKLNQLYPNITFMKNDCVVVEDVVICGSRGWVCPNDTRYTEHDEKIYKREVQRMKTSLQLALQKKPETEEIILMMHFPPTNDKKEASGFTALIQEYPIKKVVYGHLHGSASYGASFLGENQGVMYYLTSCDYVDFKPIQIV